MVVDHQKDQEINKREGNYDKI
jgi:hypothetical protein